MRTSAVLCALALAGCADTYQQAPTDYYVASVYREDGRLMANRCELTPYGHATQVCEPVAVDDPPRSPMPEGIDLPQPGPRRPAPDAAALAHAIDASGAGRLVARCRALHTDDGAAALDADVTLAPDGAIARLVLRGASGTFADCAAAALHTTTIAPFDGAPVTLRVSL